MVNESLTSTYFTALQMLRIMTERINEGLECLTTSRAELDSRLRWCADVPADDRTRLNKNWDTLIANMQRRQKKLLERIKRKTEEVESLQGRV